MALYTANVYSAKCEMSASACTHSTAGYFSQTTYNYSHVDEH